jgi:hypothetical protein
MHDTCNPLSGFTRLFTAINTLPNRRDRSWQAIVTKSIQLALSILLDWIELTLHYELGCWTYTNKRDGMAERGHYPGVSTESPFTIFEAQLEHLVLVWFILSN